MFPSFPLLRQVLESVIVHKAEQGHVTAGLKEELAALPDSYDVLRAFARRLSVLPLREDWSYVEPSDLAGIWAECDPSRPLGTLGPVDLADAAKHVEAAFLGSVCGCILGKPLEINPTLDETRKALEETGEWPLHDYVSEKLAGHYDRPLHGSWGNTVRERIQYVASDDDINYTLLGMLILEEHGPRFTREHVRAAWLRHLPITQTFGPERFLLLKAGMQTLGGAPPDYDEWVNVLNPKEEYCGALIRADAYGYACPGRPALAAELAWRDASWSHRRTGIYGSMFVAAALACAQVLRDRLAVFDTALKFVPRRSRFHAIVSDALHEVSQARDWQEGYYRIHCKYKQYGHCRVFQECGTLINTLRFAEDVGHGICVQVMQGCDADSFGATSGSILGAWFGPGHLEARWLAPFHDEIRTSLAFFYERSLAQVARRMAALPERVARDLAAVEAAAPAAAGERDALTGL